MKNLFNDISQEERKRILEMHENATKKNYLNEQNLDLGGFTDDEKTKMNRLKTSPEDLNRFLQISQDTVKSILPNLVFKTKEQWDSIKYPFQQALTWYGKSGKNPIDDPLSTVFNKIGGDFPHDYQIMVKGDPNESGKGMIADGKKLNNIFTQLYKIQLGIV